MMLRALLVFLLYKSGDGDDPNVDFGKISIKDPFGEDSSLLFSGRDLGFDCICKDRCKKMSVTDGATSWESKDQAVESVSHSITGSLTSRTTFGDYVCSDNGKSSSIKFPLKYLLCEDGSEMCHNLLNCPKPNIGSQFQFCVITGGPSHPGKCETLSKKNCPPVSFWRKIYPCVEDQTKGKTQGASLCEVFANQEKVLYTVENPENCNATDYLKVTSKGERIYLGSIGEFGSLVTVDAGNYRECSETWSSDEKLARGFKDDFPLKTDLQNSYVSRIKCWTTAEPIATTYFFNVRFSVEMKFEINGGKITCQLIKPPHPKQMRLFRYSVKITRDGDPWNSTTEKTTLEIDGRTCGTYRCDVWMEIRHCNPFFAKQATNNDSIVVADKTCLTPPPPETTTIETGIASSTIGISVGVAVSILVFIVIFVAAVYFVKRKSSKKGKKSGKGKKKTGKSMKRSSISTESVQKTENRSITNKPRPNKKKTLYTVSLPAKLIQVYVEDKRKVYADSVVAH